jgi:hypothetical protein
MLYIQCTFCKFCFPRNPPFQIPLKSLIPWTAKLRDGNDHEQVSPKKDLGCGVGLAERMLLDFVARSRTWGRRVLFFGQLSSIGSNCSSGHFEQYLLRLPGSCSHVFCFWPQRDLCVHRVLMYSRGATTTRIRDRTPKRRFLLRLT